MAFKFLVVPARDSANAEQELNRFLASHKVLSIDRELIDQGMNSFWAICVDYLNSTVIDLQMVPPTFPCQGGGWRVGLGE